MYVDSSSADLRYSQAVGPLRLQEWGQTLGIFRQRVVRIPKPKGGAKRAFDIPLSREDGLVPSSCYAFRHVRCTRCSLQNGYSRRQRIRASRRAKGGSSNVVEVGQQRRQSFRTIATAAGVSEFDAKLLMNHTIPGVNAGYITRHKLLEDHLRSQQQAISSAVLASLGSFHTEHSEIRDWPGSDRSRRLALVGSVDQNHGQRPIVKPADREAA